MKKTILTVFTVSLLITLCSCITIQQGTGTQSSQPAASSQGGQTTTSSQQDNESAYPTPDENLEILQGATMLNEPNVFYYESYQFQGDAGEGATPRQGADLVLGSVVIPNGMIDYITAGKCIFISFDDMKVLDSANGRECYMYYISVGTANDWLMGETIIKYIASVDYQKKTAAIFDDLTD